MSAPDPRAHPRLRAWLTDDPADPGRWPHPPGKLRRRGVFLRLGEWLLAHPDAVLARPARPAVGFPAGGRASLYLASSGPSEPEGGRPA